MEIVRDNVTLDHDGCIIPVEEYKLTGEELETIGRIAAETEGLVKICRDVYVEGRRSALMDRDFYRECLYLEIMSKLRRMDKKRLRCIGAFTRGLF